VIYVNHTFTTHLALSASLQPFAGLERDAICEYPVEPSALAYALTADHLLPDANGQICAPGAPGLGLAPNVETIKQYLVDVEIHAKGRLLYRTPPLPTSV